MRFFEFQLPSQGTDLSKAIEAELSKLGSLVDQKPEITDKVNAELEKLIAMAKDSGTESEPEQPLEKPAVTPPPEETKEMAEAATASMSMTDSLINTLMSELDNVVGKAKKALMLKTLQSLVAEAKKEEFTAGKEISQNLTQSAKLLAAKISGTLEALKQQYDEQAKEGDPQAPKRESKSEVEINEELIDLIEGIFKKPISRAETPESRDESAKKILDFMNRCQSGVIDLKAKVAAGKGNIMSGISAEDKQILDMLENALMKAKPGKTAGNWGPGELGLAILGTPVNKASKGDLDVGGEMIELKASQNPKKGGRLGTRALARGTDGRKDYIPALKELLSNAGYTSKTISLEKSKPNYVGNFPGSKKGSTTQVSHFSFGQSFIEKALNPKIKGRVSKEQTVQFLQTIALSCIVDEYRTMVKTAWVSKCARDDGTIDLPMFNMKYAGMLYSLYQRVDGVGKIMVMNPISGSYYVISGPADLQSASGTQKDGNAPIQFSTETINFNDSQGKASPQIGI